MERVQSDRSAAALLGALLEASVGDLVTSPVLAEACGLAAVMAGRLEDVRAARTYGEPLAAEVLARYQAHYGAPRVLAGRAYYETARVVRLIHEGAFDQGGGLLARAGYSA